MKKFLLLLFITVVSTEITHSQEIEIIEETEVELEDESVPQKKYSFKKGIDIRNGKHGYYDGKGNLTIPYEYDSIIRNKGYSFNNKIIAIKNGKYGVINKQNQVIIPFKYQFIKRTEKERFSAKRKNKIGLINTKNKVMIPFKYDNLKYSSINGLYIFTKNEFMGVVDSIGKPYIKPDYKEIEYVFYFDAFIVTNTKGEKGMISWNKKEIVPVKYNHIEGRNTKFIVVKDSLYGAYSLEHGMVLPAIYDYIEPLRKGLGFNAIIAKDNIYSLVNRKGDIISEKQYDKIEECGGLFLCTIRNGKKGLLDKNGKQVLNNEYLDIKPFTFRKEPHRIFVKKDKLFALFNDEGKQLTPYIFEDIRYVGSKRFFVVTEEKSGKVGLLNMDGTMAEDFIFDYVDPSQGKIYGVIKDKKRVLGTY